MKIRNILAIVAFALTFIPAAHAAGDTPDEITVISYNIRMGEAKDGTNSWEYRYPASALMIDDQKPDVFGLQEAFDYQVRYMDEY